MVQDWVSDVKSFDANADEDVIAAIVRYCGFSLQDHDAAHVAFDDPTEVAAIRENFLKRDLGLPHTDAELDRGIALVGERMAGSPVKNRVTAYYLLLEQFGGFDAFRRRIGIDATGLASAAYPDQIVGSHHDTPPPIVGDSIVSGAGATGAAAVGAAGVAAAAAAHRASDHTAASHTAYVSEPYEEEKKGLGWLWFLLGALAVALGIWWLMSRQPAATDVNPATTPTGESADISATGAAPAADTVDFAAAPAEGSVTIPEGAGVTSELRDGKPLVKVYFDTAKTDVAPAFGAAAAGLKSWLDAHAGSKLAVSGFNDPTGNAAANAELSKNRAQAVGAALASAGIAQSAIELVKPKQTTDAATDKAGARRVEVVVQ